MEYPLLTILTVFCIFLYFKIQTPRLLAREAEEACSCMNAIETLICLARLRSHRKTYGILTKKDQAYLTALEARMKTLEPNITDESILHEAYEYSLTENAGNLDEIMRTTKIYQACLARTKNKALTENNEDEHICQQIKT